MTGPLGVRARRRAGEPGYAREWSLDEEIAADDATEQGGTPFSGRPQSQF